MAARPLSSTNEMSLRPSSFFGRLGTYFVLRPLVTVANGVSSALSVGSVATGRNGAAHTEEKKSASTLFAAVMLAGLSVSVFLRMMNYEMRRDEQMYVPPATLLPDMSLYTDFFYNHVPSSAWLFHFVHAALPSLGLLTTARLAVFAFWLVLALSTYWIVRRISRSSLLALFAVFAFAANELILSVAGMTATNNLLPLPLALLGTGLFVMSVSEDAVEPGKIAIAGFLLALAATFKASAVCYIPAIALSAFLLPRTLTFGLRFRRVVIPLAAGGLVGALPVLIYLVREPYRFIAHVVGFHVGPHVEYWKLANDPDVAMGLGAKTLFAYSVWLGGAGAVTIVFLIWFAICLWSDKSRLKSEVEDIGITVLLTVQTVMAVIFGFVSTPSFPQYFVLPFAVTPILMAYLYKQLDVGRKEASKTALIAALAVVTVIAAPRLLQYLPKVASPTQWKVTRIHEAGTSIASAMAKIGLSGKVATLLPIYALEGGHTVYPELATGQFIYRSAEATPAALLSYYKTASPGSIQTLFADDPPAAILIGFEPELEKPFLAFAQVNAYVKVQDFELKDRYGTGELYLRPPAFKAEP